MKFSKLFLLCFVPALLFSKSIKMEEITLAKVKDLIHESIKEKDTTVVTPIDKNIEMAISIGIPTVIEQIKACETGFEPVVTYRKWYEDNQQLSADSLTIYSDEYWSACLTMSMTNPLVLQSRFFSLFKEGQFDRAQNLLLFLSLKVTPEDENNQFLHNLFRKWLQEVKDYSYTTIEYGTKLHDKGEYKKAIAEYIHTLSKDPCNGLAYYEIGMTLMMSDIHSYMKAFTDTTDEYNIAKVVAEFYREARTYDPFLMAAYQGKKEDIQFGMYVLEVKELHKKMSEKGATLKLLRKYADACFAMEEYELAIYGYHTLLGSSIVKGKSLDEDIVEPLLTSLKKLGAEKCAAFAKEQFTLVNEQLSK